MEVSYFLYLRDGESWLMRICRWVYIIEGIFSIIVGALVWFGLPNDPSHAYFLSPRQKELMEQRAVQRAAYMGSEEFSWHEVKIALADP